MKALVLTGFIALTACEDYSHMSQEQLKARYNAGVRAQKQSEANDTDAKIQALNARVDQAERNAEAAQQQAADAEDAVVEQENDRVNRRNASLWPPSPTASPHW